MFRDQKRLDLKYVCFEKNLEMKDSLQLDILRRERFLCSQVELIIFYQCWEKQLNIWLTSWYQQTEAAQAQTKEINALKYRTRKYPFSFGNSKYESVKCIILSNHFKI